MIILKDPIAGYNMPRIATEGGMKFGVKNGLNYHKPSVPPKKVHQSGGDHLDNLDEKAHNRPSKQVAEHTNVPEKATSDAIEKDPVLVPDSHTSELMILGY